MIPFCSASRKYSEFSNFHQCTISIDNFIYRSSENYYQSQKMKILGAPAEEIHLAAFVDSPLDSKMRAKNFQCTASLASIIAWQSCCVTVLTQANWAKYQQNILLKELLLSTRGFQLVENTKDNFWASGRICKETDVVYPGYNTMGKILMYIRSERKSKRPTLWSHHKFSLLPFPSFPFS